MLKVLRVFVLAGICCLMVASTACGIITGQVSVDSSGVPGNGTSFAGNTSANGRYVVFASDATNLVEGDTNDARDVFVVDVATGVTERVSVASGDPGAEANGASCEISPMDGDVWEPPCISQDGRYVVFSSSATNLVTGDTNGFRDVFLRDRTAHTTSRISTLMYGQSNGISYYPSISGNGSRVAFVSTATNLVSGDTNGRCDVFVKDVSAGTMLRVDVSSDPANAQATGSGDDSDMTASISAGGLHVAFVSDAVNLVSGDTNGTTDVFIRDLSSNLTERVSVSSAGAQGNGFCWGHLNYISGDGSIVAFSSYSDNLVPGDTNGCDDVFVRNRTLGTTTRVSVSATGEQGNGESSDPSCSANGSVISFMSTATNLAVPAGDGSLDCYVVNKDGTGMERVAVASTGVPLAGWDVLPFVSSDGKFVSFTNIPDSADVSTMRAMVCARTSLPVSDAKCRPDLTTVSVSGAAATARFDGEFYIEQDGISTPGRVSGIMVAWPGLVQVGKRYSVTGQMKTNDDGERYIEATLVNPHTSGRTVSLLPFRVSQRGLGGAAWNYAEGGTSGQVGIQGAFGLNNIGLSVAVWGKVTKIAPDKTYFYIDDGCHLKDGTSDSGSPNVGVRVLLNPIDLSLGDMVAVQGISSCFRDSGQVKRLVKGTGFMACFPAAPGFIFGGVSDSDYPNDLQIIFNTVVGATGYRLYRSTNGVDYSLVSEDYTSMFGAGIFLRTEFVNVYFQVKAVGPDGQEGAASQTVYAKVQDARQRIQIIDPAENATGVSRTPTTVWQPIAGTVWTGVEIHDGSQPDDPTVWGAMMMQSGSSLAYGTVGNCLTYVPAIAPLAPLTQNWLHVYAIDADRWQFASSYDWPFTTGP